MVKKINIGINIIYNLIKKLVIKPKHKEHILKHFGQVGLAILSVALMSSPAVVSDPAEVALAGEGGKAVLEQALKAAKSKPALILARTIVRASCIPVAGASASASMCITCGILLAKVMG